MIWRHLFAITLAVLILNLRYVLPARMSDYEAIEVEIGKEVLGTEISTAVVDQATIQKVLAGVEMGNKESIYFFALYKLHGIGLAKNLTTAALNFERSAKLGHVEATTAYGVMRMHGQGLELDYSVAVNYFRKAVALGDINAHWFLGKLLMEGLGVPEPEHEEAFKLFTTASQHNIPQASHFLGVMHEYGLGVEQDFESAFEMYQRASNQNYAESTYHLALMHAYGRGTQQNFKAATALFDNGARNDHAPSTYYMGVIKLYGYGCEPNYNQAVNWFERAAGMGDPRVEQDAREAVEETKMNIERAQKVHEETIDRLRARAEQY